jgi:hypothetical protein
VTAPDGRIWTVERVDIEPREKKPRPYPHEIDEDDVWWLALFSPRVDLLLGCGFFVILVVIGVALPLTCALALTGAAYATERYRRHLRRRGRAPWTIRASTAPTEYEHGID